MLCGVGSYPFAFEEAVDYGTRSVNKLENAVKFSLDNAELVRGGKDFSHAAGPLRYLEHAILLTGVGIVG